MTKKHGNALHSHAPHNSDILLPHTNKSTQQANSISIETNQKMQVESQWIVAQRLLSALTIPVLSGVVCKAFVTYPDVVSRVSPRFIMIVRTDAIC